MALSTNWTATENNERTPVVMQHASRAVRMRCSAVSFGVTAGITGTTASGSPITRSKLAARKMDSNNLMDPNQIRIPAKLN